MGTLQQHFLMGQIAPQENLLHRDTHDNAPARLRELHARHFRGVDGMLDLEFYARPPRYFVGKRLDELLGSRWEKLLGKPRQYVTLLVTDAVQGPAPEIDYRYARRLLDLTERAAAEIERRGGLLPEIIQTYLELLEQYEANETLTRTDSGLLIPGAGGAPIVVPGENERASDRPYPFVSRSGG